MSPEELHEAQRIAALLGTPQVSDEDLQFVLTMTATFRRHPRLALVWTEETPAGRNWFARGRDGHPWLIASSDFERFSAQIDALGQ
jgi:hypothetical protein